ncbi:MAG: AAA family ATPase [Atribacterota bacterium]
MSFIDDSLTPKQVVQELDRYIIGQTEAKKSVAIALRNRTRRRMLPPDIAEEVTPKNIIMIGPTGVGKTEIARRIAKLTSAPFVKVEATKFTEVGYVGKDVESIIRDLSELAIRMVKSEKIAKMEERTKEVVEERLLDALFTKRVIAEAEASDPGSEDSSRVDVVWPRPTPSVERTREKFRERLKKGDFEDRIIEIEVEESSSPVEAITVGGMDNLGVDFSGILGGFFPPRKKLKKVKIREAREILFNQEAQKMLDMDEVKNEAVRRVEESGIVFINEIQKIA